MAAELKDILKRADTLSFDCYGTLVDWESGLTASLVELGGPEAAARAAELFESYLEAEAAIEGAGYQPYRAVIAAALRRAVQVTGASADTEIDAAQVVAQWQPFPDTVEALRRLKQRYRLGVLSNIDKELFAETAELLQVEFDFAVTAEEVRAYKPAHLHFHRMCNVHAKRDKVVHVAQSLFHDGTPARQLDLPYIWINRRGQQNETEATPLAVFPDLKSLADAVDEMA